MSFVLDASVAVAWAYEDETTPEIRAVIERIDSEKAIVPAFWRIEMANSLEMGVRRGRTSALTRDRILAAYKGLSIQTDTETELHAWGETSKLAVQHRLTIYDAAYLELALRLELPLATLDKALRKAAEAEGLVLLGL